MKNAAFPLWLFLGAIPLSGCVVINIHPTAEPGQTTPEPKQAAQGRVDSKPQPFNVDFGVWKPEPSPQVGPAAAGSAGDYWNVVGEPFNHAHTEFGLKFANHQASPIRVEMLNLGGGWSAGKRLGIDSPMLNTYNYPANNRGGNASVILYDVPPGTYNLYLYGHGTDAPYYGDYTVKVADHSYGRKTTSKENDAMQNSRWVEGSQYVKFSGLKVDKGERIEILIRPGGEVESSGRVFQDAMIAGLQLIPATSN
jgi:hypothetical protein